MIWFVLIAWICCSFSFALGALWASGWRDAYIRELEELIRKINPLNRETA